MGDGKNRGKGAYSRETAQLAKATHKTVDESMPEERIYVIPLRETKRVPRQKRTSRTVKVVHKFLRRHMKSEKIKLDQVLNRKLWERGAEHPLPRIRVRVVKQDDGSVEAFLAE